MWKVGYAKLVSKKLVLALILISTKLHCRLVQRCEAETFKITFLAPIHSPDKIVCLFLAI